MLQENTLDETTIQKSLWMLSSVFVVLNRQGYVFGWTCFTRSNKLQRLLLMVGSVIYDDLCVFIVYEWVAFTRVWIHGLRLTHWVIQQCADFIRYLFQWAEIRRHDLTLPRVSIVLCIWESLALPYPNFKQIANWQLPYEHIRLRTNDALSNTTLMS